MKKAIQLLFLASFLVIYTGSRQASAQEKKGSTIHITIEEDEGVTTDTSFQLSEGQDPEMIKKMIMHLAGDDMKDFHITKKMHAGHSGAHKMVWITDDEEGTWTAKDMMIGVDLDSIKEAHGGEKVMVFKDKDGNIQVKELDDEHVLHMNKDHDGKHGEMMFIEAGEDGEVIHIKKSKTMGAHGQHKVIMKELKGDCEGDKEIEVIVVTDVKGDCEGKEKTVKVLVEGDEHMEWVEEGDEDVDVYVYKSEDGKDVKVVKKKVKVEIEEEVEKPEKAEKSEKKKKKK